MPEAPLLYYITDRAAFPGDEPTRRRLLLEKIAEAASAGVDYIQLREKDLSARDLESLAREAVKVISEERKQATDHRPLATALLVNSRTDVALAVGAAGVHLPTSDIAPQEVKTAWQQACGSGRLARSPSSNPLMSVSCHSPQEVIQAAANQATLALFAPVFEKNDSRTTTPAGLEALRQACRANIPVFALGGVTMQNAESCLKIGAAGIAAIRLFQENDIMKVVRDLRNVIKS